MFVDTLTITAKAGNGGDGVVRWRHEKYKPLAGPAGGDGGRGGDVYIEGVADNNALRKYVGATSFEAGHGESGQKKSKAGHHGTDITIYVPIGSTITDNERDRQFTITTVGERVKILSGGRGGRGNEHYKTSTNRSPETASKGIPGEHGTFRIEVTLAVSVGIIGLPNSGKSTLLNTLTNATSRVGDFPFTTLEPHLGDLYGFTLADIPGLIEGAAEGRGLGYTFLRHITRTQMLLHVVSLAEPDLEDRYYTIRNELAKYSEDLSDKEEWLVLSKKDLVLQEDLETLQSFVDKFEKRVFVISCHTGEGVKVLRDTLVEHLRNTYNG